MKTKLTSYLPAMDGFRAISILMVYLSHLVYFSKISASTIIPGGFGVIIFFYISGFLITRLLLGEIQNTNRIDIKMFYIRRMIRLYPPLVCMLVLATLYLAIVKHFIPYKELISALLYFENYYMRLFDSGPNYYGILWSLAVEEHFYLLYPLVFLIFAKKPNQLLIATIIFTIIPLLFRCYIAIKYNANPYSDGYTYLLSHCRFDSILFGCLSSLLINSKFGEKYGKITSNTVVYIIGLLLIIFSLFYRSDFFRQTFRYSVMGIALMILIPPVIYSARYVSINKLLSSKIMVSIGKWSYSIYLFHFVVINILEDYTFSSKGLYVIVNISLSLLLSLSSYYFIERPFFRLRKKFGSRVRSEEVVPLQTATIAN